MLYSIFLNHKIFHSFIYSEISSSTIKSKVLLLGNGSFFFHSQHLVPSPLSFVVIVMKVLLGSGKRWDMCLCYSPGPSYTWLTHTED